MIKHPAHVTFTVLCDRQDESGNTVSEAPPSFSASWFDVFKNRYQISYCRLHGEGLVDLQAIEPELAEIDDHVALEDLPQAREARCGSQVGKQARRIN
ncbi:hypothetical protein BGX29_011362 [Mortierella sp. GBA35]|nr:hypothetical protein BGX23_008398 [Mortierella sp. AD031]KAF9090619.1 hypothetical protein BGX29_011362 [Mortierella sp. GBA35]